MERKYLVYCYLGVLAAVIGHLEATCGGDTEQISNPSQSYQVDPPTSTSMRLACKLDYAGSSCTRDYNNFQSVWRVFVIGENGAGCSKAHCNGFSARHSLGTCNSTDCSRWLYLDLDNILAEDSNRFNNSVFMCGVRYTDSHGITRHHWAPTISFLHFAGEEPPPPTSATPTLATPTSVTPTPTLCEDSTTTSTVTMTMESTPSPSPTAIPEQCCCAAVSCPSNDSVEASTTPSIQVSTDTSTRNETTMDWKDVIITGAPAALVLLVSALFLPLLIWIIKLLQKIKKGMEVLLTTPNGTSETYPNHKTIHKQTAATNLTFGQQDPNLTFAHQEPNLAFEHQDPRHVQSEGPLTPTSNSPPTSPGSGSPTADTPMMPLTS